MTTTQTSKPSDSAITYTNNASIVAFQPSGDSCRVIINERIETMNMAAALDFEDALKEAGYWVAG